MRNSPVAARAGSAGNAATAAAPAKSFSVSLRENCIVVSMMCWWGSGLGQSLHGFWKDVPGCVDAPAHLEGHPVNARQQCRARWPVVGEVAVGRVDAGRNAVGGKEREQRPQSVVEHA